MQALPDTITHVHQHLVSYGETDAMGIVYYAEYLHFFERARSTFIRALGSSYNGLVERGLHLPVREAVTRYRASAHFDELLNIKTCISEFGRATISFNYEIIRESDNKLLTTGMTQHACVRPDGKPIPVPEWFKELCSSQGK